MIDADQIALRQAFDANLRTQAAARQKFTQAKQIRRARYLGTMALLVAGPLHFFILGSAGGLVAAASACWLLVTRLVLTPIEMRWRRQGAYLADRYDSDVLGIPYGFVVPADLVSKEESNSAADRYVRSAGRWWKANRRRGDSDPYERLRGWFAVPAGFRGPEAILACQRGSAEYARRLAVEWSRLCDVFWVTVVVAYIVIAYVGDLSLREYLIALAFPSVPGVLDAQEAGSLHRRMARLRRTVVRQAESALAGDASQIASMDLCRNLQDEAWRWRTSGPGCPDSYYELRRRRLDADASAAASSLSGAED